MVRIGVTGLIAYEAALRHVNEHRSELEKRFSRRFMKNFDALKGDVQTTRVFHGGLFAALWRAMDFLEENSTLVKKPVGCRVNLMDIPLCQEIVEICELYDENPYEADSCGAYLVIWNEDDPESAAYFHMGDPALDRTAAQVVTDNVVQIGYITCSKDRLIINGDMIRYLTPYRRQLTDITARKNDRRH